MSWLHIARKELIHHGNHLTAYLLAALFTGAPAVFLFWIELPSNLFLQGVVDLRPFFSTLPFIFALCVPAIAMRTWSEEMRTGTMELLETWPIHPSALVFGKFLGNFVLLMLCLIGTGSVTWVTAQLGPLDFGPVFGGYLGAVFLLAASLAVSMFLGALTKSQPAAFLLGTAALFALMFLPFQSFNFFERFSDFARGVPDSRDLVFFSLVTVLFLALNSKILEARRS